MYPRAERAAESVLRGESGEHRRWEESEGPPHCTAGVRNRVDVVVSGPQPDVESGYAVWSAGASHPVPAADGVTHRDVDSAQIGQAHPEVPFADGDGLHACNLSGERDDTVERGDHGCVCRDLHVDAPMARILTLRTEGLGHGPGKRDEAGSDHGQHGGAPFPTRPIDRTPRCRRREDPSPQFAPRPGRK